jgi:ABC-type branched-subunit amino acid transport system ATPase component
MAAIFARSKPADESAFEFARDLADRYVVMERGEIVLRARRAYG